MTGQVTGTLNDSKVSEMMDAKTIDTRLSAVACSLSILEAIVVKYERLAAGGTHQDLPGNGQEQDTDDLYL